MSEIAQDDPFLADLAEMRDEPLNPELEPWVEDGIFGDMLRHPLVYDMMVRAMPGMANRMFEQKKKRLAEALADEDWHTVVFLHERPYRLKALLDYCLGRDLDGFPWPLVTKPQFIDLAENVWIDSENIEQEEDGWRAIVRNGAGIWLGDEDEKKAFDALPDPIPAWRGGIVGDWSWTTDKKVAEFFAHRFGAGREVRFALIPKADVFGYLLGRGESELMVKLTDERRPLVYPQEFE